MEKFAAVGTNGLVLVVWGLGATEAEALADAAHWTCDGGAYPGPDLTVHPVTEAQAAAIEAGDVSWKSLA